VTDQVAITINNAPTVDAGLDKEVCEGTGILMGDASFGGSATTVTWSGGSGSFTPSTTTLLATYAHDPAETGTTVRLYIQTNDPVGPCVAAIDSVDITVNVAPVVDAGVDKQLCFPDSIQMSDANFSGSTSTVTWSGGAGTFYPNTTTLAAWYVPAASEIGTTVVLTMTSDDPDGAGPCEPVTDQVAITINNAPTVDAGLDKEVCEGTGILMGDASMHMILQRQVRRYGCIYRPMIL
jgi:hypothetical protein